MNPDKHGPSLSSLISKLFNYSKSHQGFILTSLSVLLVITAYVWFISFGSWTRWPFILHYNVYYDELASAFQHGNLSLEIQPTPALLALHNPYDPASRQFNNIPYPIDFSLYKGKFYLYFGPVPALFLLAIKLLGAGTIGDHYLVFVFISGIFIFQSLLIIKIWRRFFQNISIWIISLCILFCGLISPIPWILTNARVYEAASASGQFFFLAGLYFVIAALDRESISIGQFLIAGTSWALAIGSRVTQIVPIGFVTLMVVFLTFRVFKNTLRSNAVGPLMSLCSPLVIGLAFLGWYNWARFDSVFETGFYYELAGPFLQKYSHVLFSPLYLLPNLYNYLIMRPKLNMVFPFVQSVPGVGAIKFSFISLPLIYHEGAITGILFSTPFVLFAVIPIRSLLPKKKEITDRAGFDHDAYLFNWLMISLSGSFLFGFAPIILYFFVETRFVVDFIPTLILLSIIGFWQGYNLLTHKLIISKLYAALGIILMIASILISILLAFSANADNFQRFNPVLWGNLIRLFSR
jgi:hypothetical protein